MVQILRNIRHTLNEQKNKIKKQGNIFFRMAAMLACIVLYCHTGNIEAIYRYIVININNES